MNRELLDDLNYLDQVVPEKIYVGFWRRLMATILDVFAFALMMLCWAVFTELLALVLPRGASYVLQEICVPIIILLYLPLWESSSFQGSLGKQILGMKVVGKDGQGITFWRALARLVAKMLSYSLAFIGFVMIAFTDKKCGLHDFIVETYVVEA